MATDELEGIATYIFKWNALSDACPKCRSLNGKEYEKDRLYHEVIWDGGWGDIWDLNTNRSLAHPNCRCQLAVRVECDWTKWETFQKLNRTLANGGRPMATDVPEMKREMEELKKTVREMNVEGRACNSIMDTTLMLMTKTGMRTPAQIRQIISLLYAVQAAYRAVQLARMAAGDPLAWIGAGAEALGLTVSIADMSGCFG